MPYISPEARAEIDAGRAPEDAGELNYAISRLIEPYLARQGPIRYATVNGVVGVLECAKLELYRRVAAPYEDAKCAENGDVYGATIR
jgi:hypothetical protein